MSIAARRSPPRFLGGRDRGSVLRSDNALLLRVDQGGTANFSLSPFLPGEGRGEGLSPRDEDYRETCTPSPEFSFCKNSTSPRKRGEVKKNSYRRVSRQPAASASSTEQNQRVPFEIFISIFAYQRLVGW